MPSAPCFGVRSDEAPDKKTALSVDPACEQGHRHGGPTAHSENMTHPDAAHQPSKSAKKNAESIPSLRRQHRMYHLCIILFAAVIGFAPIYFPLRSACILFGPSGLACRVTHSACLVPVSACLAFFPVARAPSTSEALETALAVTARSRVVTELMTETTSLLKKHGYSRRSYSSVYADMKRTQQQSVDVREKGARVLDRMSATADMAHAKLTYLRMALVGLIRDFDSNPRDPAPLMQFLQSLGESIDNIIAPINDETDALEDLHGEVQLLLQVGNALSDGLDTLLSHSETAAVLRRAEALTPYTVTPGDRVAGGASSAAVGAVTYGACVLFPPFVPVAAPAAAVVTGSLAWLAHRRAQRLEKEHEHAAVVHERTERVLGAMHESVPAYLNAVQNAAARTKAAARQLQAARDSLGNAEAGRLRILENRKVSRTLLWQLLGFLDSAIADADGSRRLVRVGNDRLKRHEEIGMEAKSPVLIVKAPISLVSSAREEIQKMMTDYYTALRVWSAPGREKVQEYLEPWIVMSAPLKAILKTVRARVGPWMTWFAPWKAKMMAVRVRLEAWMMRHTRLKAIRRTVRARLQEWTIRFAPWKAKLRTLRARAGPWMIRFAPWHEKLRTLRARVRPWMTWFAPWKSKMMAVRVRLEAWMMRRTRLKAIRKTVRARLQERTIRFAPCKTKLGTLRARIGPWMMRRAPWKAIPSTIKSRLEPFLEGLELAYRMKIRGYLEHFLVRWTPDQATKMKLMGSYASMRELWAPVEVNKNRKDHKKSWKRGRKMAMKIRKQLRAFQSVQAAEKAMSSVGRSYFASFQNLWYSAQGKPAMSNEHA